MTKFDAYFNREFAELCMILPEDDFHVLKYRVAIAMQSAQFDSNLVDSAVEYTWKGANNES